MNNKNEMALKKLWDDYLDLCDKYKDELPSYKFGSALIAYATRMLIETAPSEQVAIDLIMNSIAIGYDMRFDEIEE